VIRSILRGGNAARAEAGVGRSAAIVVKIAAALVGGKVPAIVVILMAREGLNISAIPVAIGGALVASEIVGALVTSFRSTPRITLFRSTLRITSFRTLPDPGGRELGSVGGRLLARWWMRSPA
jgi:hypothetical protein